MKKEVNSTFFKDIGFSLRGLIFQLIIISLITNIAGVLLTHNSKESVYGMIIEEAATFLGVIFLIIRDARNDCKVNMQNPKHPVKFVTLLNMFACLVLAQVLTEILFYIIEWGLNTHNYTMMLAESVNTVGENNIIVALCIGISAPILEELTYRGILLKQLRKYGDWYAIIITAILFGLRHFTLSQVSVGMLTGLLFGYITIRYGIKWSILLHILNNFVLGVILGNISNVIPGHIVEYIWMIVIIVLAVYAVIMLIKSRKSICTSLVQQDSIKTELLHTLRVPSFVIIMVYSIITNIVMLQMFIQKM